MEANPRKKLKLGLGSVERTNRTEEYPENEDEGCLEKYKTPALKNGKNTTKFCLDISLEEDEKLLGDSGIELQESGEEKSFEIRRISANVALSEREEPPPVEKPETENPSTKHSYCRGEMPETNESEKSCEGRFLGKNGDASDDVTMKKTPDKSLFRKVQEKLMYECSLTPKKVKKKCLELKMDL